jgi:hypothetical protein
VSRRMALASLRWVIPEIADIGGDERAQHIGGDEVAWL